MIAHNLLSADERPRGQIQKFVVAASLRNPAKPGSAVSEMGYIVAMRWAINTHSPAIFTTLSAEDPQTRDECPFFDESHGFAAAVRSLQYVPSLANIRQQVLST